MSGVDVAVAGLERLKRRFLLALLVLPGAEAQRGEALPGVELEDGLALRSHSSRYERRS